MIAFVNRYPMVRHEGGDLVRFDAEWLQDCLELMLRKAGVAERDGWVVVHIVQTVSFLVFESYRGRVLCEAELDGWVRGALVDLGMGELADGFRFFPPCSEISLLEIAKDAGSGFEMGFFQILRNRLYEVLSKEVLRLRCSDLKGCVKFLRGGKRWNKDCGMLQEEIVCFIRECVEAPAEQIFKLQFQ